MMVEKAKNSRQIATKMSPNPRNTVENATCAMFSAAGFVDMSATFSAPLVIITSAVIVSTTKVSMNTQIMATIP